MNLRTITVQHASELTGFAVTRIYRMVRAGELRYLKGGPTNQTIRIFQNSLEEWMTAHAKGGTTDAAPSSAVNGDDALPPVDHPAFS